MWIPVCRWTLVLSLLATGVLSQEEVGVPSSDEVAGYQTIVETEGENTRVAEVPADDRAARISFIDSPTVTCYQPNPALNQCFINWYSTSVSASPNYIIEMKITINLYGVVAYHQGFFQTSMYVPYNMRDRGFRVPCGSLGDGGKEDLGAVYAWTIWARDSADLKSTNYGSTYCPAFIP